MNDSRTNPQDTKKLFMKLGTCSRTFCHMLNREFGHPEEAGERAADPLAGGLMLQGHQCGMLWGAALAAGAESFRRFNDRGEAACAAITAARSLMESFTKRAGSADCRDVTGYDLTSRLDMMKFMVKFILHLDRRCFDLADKWAPEAIRSAVDGLSRGQTGFTQMPVSCASEVAKKMGAGEEEAATVAGFAGGLGLSGNACGALAAATWIKCLAWSRENPGKSTYGNPDAKKTLKAFYDTTGSEILCSKITGRCFKTMEEHSEFMKNGGCNDLINVLAGV